MIVTPPPKEPYQPARQKRELAKAEAAPIQVGIPGAASHGRALLARGKKEPADLTNSGISRKHGGKAKTTLPEGHRH